jgi:hypothetical protein
VARSLADFPDHILKAFFAAFTASSVSTVPALLTLA